MRASRGSSDGNLGLHDQLASLRWIQRCIAVVWRDAENVTIAGQSAGAFAVLALGGHDAGERPGSSARSCRAGRSRSTPTRLKSRGAGDGACGSRCFRANGNASRGLDRSASSPPAGLSRGGFRPDPAISPHPTSHVSTESLSVDLCSGPLKPGAAAWCPMIAGYTRRRVHRVLH